MSLAAFALDTQRRLTPMRTRKIKCHDPHVNMWFGERGIIAVAHRRALFNRDQRAYAEDIEEARGTSLSIWREHTPANRFIRSVRDHARARKRT